MKSELNRAVALRFRQQYGVIGRRELRGLGVSAKQEAVRVAAGDWERPTRRVIRLAGSTRSAHQELMIALVHCGPGAVVSHQSAAWLWDLVEAPDRPTLTIGSLSHYSSGPYVLHRARDLPVQVSMVGNMACTNPLRTLVDLAGVCPADRLDEALDRAVARRLVSVEGVRAEMDRLSRRGRNGTGAMRAAIERRRLSDGPSPSVLESRFLRLLRRGGITPLAVEVRAGPDGEFRVDTLLDPAVAVEVDGHVYHSTPEQKAYDEQRRTRIRLAGTFLLVYDWAAVTYDGRRVIAECSQALAVYGAGRSGSAPAGLSR